MAGAEAEVNIADMEQIQSLRASGHVRRWHTVHHLKEQSVAEHSAQAVSLLLLLHPNPSVDLIKAMLWHDSAERHVGDMPAPVRRDAPELACAYEAAESRFFELHTTVFSAMARLTEEDWRWLKAIDTLELFLYCHDEMFLGNQHFAIIEKRARSYLAQGGDKVPEQVTQFVQRFQPRSFA